MNNFFHIYFHGDFDGICSAVLFSKIIDTFAVGNVNFIYHSLDYDSHSNWWDLNIETPNAVLDFRYHSQANWWFDHHVSAFPNYDEKAKFKNDSLKKWDITFASCPELIKSHFIKQFPLFFHKDSFSKFEEWIKWSSIIDSAKYKSPKDLIEIKHPCLKINASLAIETTSNYHEYLIEHIKEKTPIEVASLNRVRENFTTFQKKQENILEIFKKIMVLSDTGIVFFDQSDIHEVSFQRYLSYYFYPEAKYTIGIYKKNQSVYSVSVGKNPWKSFNSKNIGKICKRFGGGGRLNVGAVYKSNHVEALNTAKKIKKSLNEKLINEVNS